MHQSLTRVLLIVAIVAGLGTPPALARQLQRVDYLAESILDVDDDVIRLEGGSAWLLMGPSLVLPLEDVIIVIRTVPVSGRAVQLATAYIDGDEIPVRHLRGSVFTSAGYLSRVVEEIGDGAVLRLADGSLLSVPDYDRFNTGWWLPPYPVLLTGNRAYLYNLRNAKRVWVSPIAR
jgi:hypothetical protein